MTRLSIPKRPLELDPGVGKSKSPGTQLGPLGGLAQWAVNPSTGKWSLSQWDKQPTIKYTI